MSAPFCGRCTSQRGPHTLACRIAQGAAATALNSARHAFPPTRGALGSIQLDDVSKDVAAGAEQSVKQIDAVSPSSRDSVTPPTHVPSNPPLPASSSRNVFPWGSARGLSGAKLKRPRAVELGDCPVCAVRKIILLTLLALRPSACFLLLSTSFCDCRLLSLLLV